jgi:hypothetical protein
MDQTELCSICGRDMEYTGQVGTRVSFLCECGQRYSRRVSEDEASEGDRMGDNYSRYGVPSF